MVNEALEYACFLGLCRKLDVERLVGKKLQAMNILDLACGSDKTGYPPHLSRALSKKGYHVIGVDRFEAEEPFEHYGIDLVDKPERLGDLEIEFDLVYDGHFSGGNLYPELIATLEGRAIERTIFTERLNRSVAQILGDNGIYIRCGGSVDQIFQRKGNELKNLS